MTDSLRDLHGVYPAVTTGPVQRRSDAHARSCQEQRLYTSVITPGALTPPIASPVSSDKAPVSSLPRLIQRKTQHGVALETRHVKATTDLDSPDGEAKTTGIILQVSKNLPATIDGDHVSMGTRVRL